MKAIDKITDQYLEFECSGKQLCVNASVIVLWPDLGLTDSYGNNLVDKLTNQEVNELADYMIDLWEKYRKANTHKIMVNIALDDSRVKKQMRKVKRTIFLLRVKMSFKALWKGFLLAIERGLIRK